MDFTRLKHFSYFSICVGLNFQNQKLNDESRTTKLMETKPVLGEVECLLYYANLDQTLVVFSQVCMSHKIT